MVWGSETWFLSLDPGTCLGFRGLQRLEGLLVDMSHVGVPGALLFLFFFPPQFSFLLLSRFLPGFFART